jgi:hypothetical protein
MAHLHKASFDLPAAMSRDIGRLIIRYAYLEQYLQNVIYMVLGVEAGIGRLAVREPGRLTDKLDLLRDLIAAKKLDEPDVDFKELRDAIEDAMDFRNLCAHSTWTWADNMEGWAVFVSRGQWTERPKTDRAARSKRLYPEGQVVRSNTLRSYVVGLAAIEKLFRGLQADLERQIREK